MKPLNRAIFGLVCAAIIIGAMMYQCRSGEPAAVQSPAPPTVEDPQRGPRPETGFGGEVLEVKQYLRKTLNDYDSSEFVEWSPVSEFTDSTGSYWVVRLKLRAKNGLGAYRLLDTYYFIQHGRVVRAKGLE